MTKEQEEKYLNEHLTYEIDMLGFSHQMLFQVAQEIGKFSPSNSQISVFTPDDVVSAFFRRNIFIEAFILHARCLVEFFYHDRKKHPDDARAGDFIRDKDWSKVRSELDGPLLKLMGRSGKEIAHLTYSRIDGIEPEKAWDDPNILKELIITIDKFIDAIGQKSSNLKELYAAIKRLKAS